MSTRKIAVFTSTRADYGHLCKILELIEAHHSLELQLFVTGTHLSKQHGHTIDTILQDGFSVTAQIPVSIQNDNAQAICAASAETMRGIAAAIRDNKPDILLVLGDRFETLAAAFAANICRVPIAHLHGGEITQGALDDGFRHAITKLSKWHFVAAEEFRNRVIQLGESPECVFNTGAPGLDSIDAFEPLSRQQLSESLGIPVAEKLLLVTYHPETAGENASKNKIDALCHALEQFPEYQILVSSPNVDESGDVILNKWRQFAEINGNNVHLFSSFGQERYYSLMTVACAVIGNSSSGIIEAPSFGVPTVNIGMRQQGRPMAKSVFSCDADSDAIVKTIRQAISFNVTKRGQIANPYKGKQASQKIVNTLASVEITNLKHFHDLAC
jgi:UDP-N-acetylglucosamine 2-epimerase (non-hydrolysing)